MKSLIFERLVLKLKLEPKKIQQKETKFNEKQDVAEPCRCGLRLTFFIATFFPSHGGGQFRHIPEY